MYEDVLDTYEKLLIEKDIMGLLDTEDHWINDQISECLAYLERHL